VVDGAYESPKAIEQFLYTLNNLQISVIMPANFDSDSLARRFLCMQLGDWNRSAITAGLVQQICLFKSLRSFRL